ncbi:MULTISPECIES: AAA family ATPase [Rugamonas]|uniref:Predicted ATP-binding protein involved in virulence n=1 Tax=Rugamonas rubra TaxID=758825 RepID=A0A1I4RPI3_9BURK|nr:MULTISPECIES: AAA family ATPase [Rugamonas]WGG49760.1 AAA family ATPase [Rugamonas sp. DEMB1]SFM54182.1 Predicted ATP-binding protein involved in virulence [Rugamonas rubra]
MPELSIQTLRLRDYRCFEDVEIEFHDKLTVLIASNGAGKTSILDAIAVAFGPYVGAFDEGVDKRFLPSDIRLSRVRATSSNEMEYAAGGAWLEATGRIGDATLRPWRRSLAGPAKAKTTSKDAKRLTDLGKALQVRVRTPDTETALPLLAYYGTGRLWQRKNLTDGGKLHRTTRTVGYSNCLDPASSYKALVAWFRYWSTNSLKAQVDASRNGQAYQANEFDDYIRSVASAVDACLAPAGWKDIAYSLAQEQLVAHHDKHGELPVELLSDGIRNMIGMVADIAFRATKLNPHFGAAASKRTSGVVLIDEVDMHLHPEWQQSVLHSLTTAFPLIQFIVTTHSPQVISSVPSESVRVLSDFAVFSAPPGTEGAESSRVLKRVFDVAPRPHIEATHELERYLALVYADQWDSAPAQALRVKLDERYRGEEPALTEADLHIENRKWERSLEAGATHEDPA